MLHTIHLQQPAMATRFEAWLIGSDPEHLRAVGACVMDEVIRLERLLSRYDPASEITRINQEASFRPVRVDVELFGLLQDAVRRFDQTNGYFDVRVPRSARPMHETLTLDPETRTLHFLEPDLTLDLGGYGKGYALDAAARILDLYGVTSALIHGGTSSVLARGCQADGTPWRIGLGDPSGDGERLSWTLTDVGFSYSGVLRATEAVSDIIDPHTGEALHEQAACAILADTALDAEVFSTALLAMGRTRSASFLSDHPQLLHEIEWLDVRSSQPVNPTVL